MSDWKTCSLWVFTYLTVRLLCYLTHLHALVCPGEQRKQSSCESFELDFATRRALPGRSPTLRSPCGQQSRMGIRLRLAVHHQMSPSIADQT